MGAVGGSPSRAAVSRAYTRRMSFTAKDLGAVKYVLVTTFRKDGTPVGTPLWVVPEGDGFAAWTARDSGKMKRIRRDPRVRIAPCRLRGEPLAEAIDAQVVEIRSGAEQEEIRRRVARKYGLLGHLITGFEKRGKHERVAIVIE